MSLAECSALVQWSIRQANVRNTIKSKMPDIFWALLAIYPTSPATSGICKEDSKMKLLIVWLLNALALLAVAYVVPSIHVAGIGSALIAAAVIGLVNLLIRPILVILTLPVTVLTLGLFLLVINGLLFLFVGHILNGFEVQTLLAGIVGAVLYSLISWALIALILGTKD